MAVPSDFANLRLWFKADSESYLENEAVGTMNDRSGNGFHATQATPANKPTFKVQIVNGLPVYRFDGSNDFCSGVAGTSIFTVSTGVLYAYVRLAACDTDTGSPWTNDSLWAPNNGASCNHSFLKVAGVPKVRAYSLDAVENNVVDKAIDFDRWYLIFWRHAGGQLYLGVDDLSSAALQQDSAADTVQLGGNFAVGGAPTTGAGYFQGDLAELFAFNVDHDEGTRTQLQQYLAFKYNNTSLLEASRALASRRLREISRPIPMIECRRRAA